MCYVKGDNLNQFGRKRQELAWFVLWSVCKTLVAFRVYNILHLDLKPSNIMWDRKNNSVVTIDLGFASLSTNGKCCSNSGSPIYFPPDNFANRDASGDVWSLGISVWEIATGINYTTLFPR